MRLISVLFVCAVLMVPAALSAQRRLPGSQEKKVGVAIDLKVNGTLYTFKGEAICDHLAAGRSTTSSPSDGRCGTTTTHGMSICPSGARKTERPTWCS